jgi:hypothetical protein
MAGLYELRAITGKGIGVLATTGISRGTRILAERPLLTASRFLNAATGNVNEIFQTLSPSRQSRYMELHNAHPELDPVAGIFKTNSLPRGQMGSVYETICRVNHSCRPNAR